MRTLLKLSPVLLLFVPVSAYALTLEYLTYNAFDETVAAFTRLGLIVSDPGFIVLAACFVAVTCIGSTIFFGTQALGGRGAHPMSMIVPFLIGTIIFWGMVIPKGTLQIYDPVRNRTEAVPDIPALLVLLAGGLSVVEKGMTDIVDTASATPYKDDVGGISYSLIFSAIKASTKSTGLDRTMAQYFKDCGMTAIGSGYNGATMDEVIHGAPGWDLYSSFAKYNHPAWPTVWFPDGNDGGTTGTCADAWTYLNGKLNGSITTTMNPMKRAACESGGFNWSNATERAACDAAMITAAGMFDPGVATSDVWLRSIAMGEAITVALNDPDFNVGINTLVNRQMMAEAFGASAAMNQWIPRLRGIMIAVAVGVAPICLLFVATPLVMRAMSVMAGLFIWLALWGICDVIALQMQQDAAFDAFTQVKEHNLGYLAIMNAPEGAVAALGVFGKARTMAMVLATVLTGGLFKLASSYAFTSMGQQWQGDFNQGGEAAGKQRLQVEQQASLQEQLNSAPGAMGRVQQFGYGTTMGASNFGAQQQVGQFDYVAGVTGGQTGVVAYQAGEISGGRTLGDIAGHSEVAGGLGSTLGGAAAAVSASNTARSGGSAIGSRERAGDELYGIGKTEGAGGVVRTEYERELSSGFTGTTEADRLKELQKQRESSTAAMADVSGHRPEEAKRYYEESGFRPGFSELAAWSEIGVSPEQIGRGRGLEGGTDAQATERTMRDFGAGAMTAGKELSKDTAAVAGRTAGELGGPAAVASVTGRNQVAGDFGRSLAQQQMAGFLFGDSTADLSRFHEAGGSVFHGTLDGDAARKVADWTESQGLISPAQASALRDKADKGFSAAVAFGEGGQIASFNLDGRYGGMVGDTFSDTSGMTYQRGDSFQSGDQTNVAQGMSFRGESAVDTLQDFVSRNAGNANLNETDQFAIAGGYAQRLASEGHTGQASASDTRLSSVTAGVGQSGGSLMETNAKGQKSLSGGGGLIGKAMALVGVRAGGDMTNQQADSWQSSQDFALTGFAGSLNENYQQAREPVLERYGAPEQWDAPTRAAAEREIAERWNTINEVGYQELKTKMLGDTVNQASRGTGESETQDKLGAIADKARDVYDAARDKWREW